MSVVVMLVSSLEEEFRWFAVTDGDWIADNKGDVPVVIGRWRGVEEAMGGGCSSAVPERERTRNSRRT